MSNLDSVFNDRFIAPNTNSLFFLILPTLLKVTRFDDVYYAAARKQNLSKFRSRHEMLNGYFFS